MWALILQGQEYRNNSETKYISNFKEFHHMCLCNFHGTKKQQQKRALWVMGTLPMANRTKGQEGETSEQKSGGSEGRWNGVREGCGAEYVGLCWSGSELAGNDAGFGVRGGGHADVIG